MKNGIDSIVTFSCARSGPLASVASLALAYSVFCLRNFLAFVAFFLRTFYIILLAYFSLRKALRALRAFE